MYGIVQSNNIPSGLKPSPYGLYETAATLNDTWGFSYFDHNWKTPDQIFAIKRKLHSLGVNYLLNVGPDPLGRINAESQSILREVARCRNKRLYVECVYVYD